MEIYLQHWVSDFRHFYIHFSGIWKYKIRIEAPIVKEVKQIIKVRK